jgi:hypothetical protein
MTAEMHHEIHSPELAPTGNPSSDGVPHGRACSAASRAVMVFNNDFHLALNPHAPERESMPRLHEPGRT